MIPTDLRARIESALTAAGQMTPGPLVLRRFVDGTGNDAAAVVHEASGETVATCDNEDRSDEARPVCDAAGIVALRNAVPDLRALLALLDAPAGLTAADILADLLDEVYATARAHGATGIRDDSPECAAAHAALRRAREVIAGATLPAPPPPEPRRPVAGWRAGVSGDELLIGTFLRLRAGALAWEVEAVKTRGLARWCETLKSGVVTGGPDAAKLAAEDAAASLLDAANVALGRK